MFCPRLPNRPLTRVIVLVHSSPVSLLRDHGRPDNLGVLVSPRGCGNFPALANWKWAADNDAFLAWDENRYVRMLDKITGVPGCLFVTSPDVVGDAKATKDRFYEWKHRLGCTRQPVAFVAQDGADAHRPPWQHIDALFIGGTTDFKLGPVAAQLAEEARRCRKWVHMGRVNTRQRIKYAKGIGCHSIDGTNFSMFRRTNLPWALEWAAHPQQLVLS